MSFNREKDVKENEQLFGEKDPSKIKRLSLPFAPSNKRNNIPNRRHTLVPSRSILKAVVDSNLTTDIASELAKKRRRVSFAPEVTLHKINFLKSSEERKPKRRSSLGGVNPNQDNNDSKLSTTKFIEKIHKLETNNENNNENIKLDNLQITNQITNQIMIDEETQTMEMSVELTQQILQQQENIWNQNTEQHNEKSVDQEEKSNSLRELFDDVEKELNSDNDEIVDIEFTEQITNSPIKNITDNEHSDRSENVDEVTMEFTEPLSLLKINDNATEFKKVKSIGNNLKENSIDNNDEIDQSELDNGFPKVNHGLLQSQELADDDQIEFTEPIETPFGHEHNFDDKIPDDPPKMEFNIQEVVEKNDESKPMEFTETINFDESIQRITSVEHEGAEDSQEDENLSSEENGNIIHRAAINPNQENEIIHSRAKLREQSIDKIGQTPIETNLEKHLSKMNSPREDIENQNYNLFESNSNLTTVEETSEPPTSSTSNNEKSNISTRENEEFNHETEYAEYNDIDNETYQHDTYQHDTTNNVSVDMTNEENEMSTDMENSLVGTEMIPLAEVTGDFTENQDDYDSDNSFTDDNHINVSLDTFLSDVNVQFFDYIGPSEMEISQTLKFNPNIKSSPESSSSPSTTTTTTSSSSSTPFTHSQAKSNLMDFIDSCINIPYYHYVIHLINQYRSSIQSISTMVNTFSNDVLEFNPTAIREYYQQADDLKSDLSTNYQAIASFTRKQAKCQNLRFVSSLLEQLILSYERTNLGLEKELNKAFEWRRNVLIERQRMIEKKMELDQYITSLNTLKDNWNSMDIERMKRANQDMIAQNELKNSTKQKISEISKSLGSKSKVLDSKRKKKEDLLKEIEELKRDIANKTIPEKLDLEKVREQLIHLEKEKSIKLLSSNPISLLIFDTLKIVFKKLNMNEYEVSLESMKSELFKPFSPLFDQFVFQNTKTVKASEVNIYLKGLIQSWKVFSSVWKELLTIHYLHSSSITGESFKLEFQLSQPIGTSLCNHIFVQGNIKDLLSKDEKITVTVESENPYEEDINKETVIENLRILFQNKNSVINRLCVE